MKNKINSALFFIVTLAITANASAAGRNNNLQVLPDRDYRKTLEEVVVTAQRSLPRSTATDKGISLEPSPTRLQWLPPYQATPESIKPRSQSEEKPLFKIFEKKF